MAKWLAVLLILLLVVAGAFYVQEFLPQREELAAAQSRAADQERQIEQLRGHIGDLEAVRDELQQASTELQQQIVQKETELAALRSTQDELVSGLKQEIADKQVQVERIQDRLRVARLLRSLGI